MIAIEDRKDAQLEWSKSCESGLWTRPSERREDVQLNIFQGASSGLKTSWNRMAYWVNT